MCVRVCVYVRVFESVYPDLSMRVFVYLTQIYTIICIQTRITKNHTETHINGNRPQKYIRNEHDHTLTHTNKHKYTPADRKTPTTHTNLGMTHTYTQTRTHINKHVHKSTRTHIQKNLPHAGN